MIYRIVLLLVFFASGFAALVYQVIWQRLLTFITGTDTQSVTIIVAAVMLGLGLGSAAGGHLADRVSTRARLRLFAACEVAIAIFSFFSVSVFYDVLYQRFGTHQLSLLSTVALHAAATLWPTFFMGLAFPLIARAMPAPHQSGSRWIALVFGVNTIGAATGALATVTLLLPSMDFTAIVRIGVAINTVCALAAFAASAMTCEVSAPARQIDERGEEPSLSFVQWAGLVALSGFAALSLEILWFRILGVMLKADAGTFGWLLAFYLGGLGGGALAGQMRLARRWPAARTYLALQAAIPLYSAVALSILIAALDGVPIFDRLSRYLSGTSGVTQAGALTVTGVVVLWLLPFALMTVPTFLMGLSFSSLQRAVQVDAGTLGRRVGWLQFANITGSVAGALLTGLWLIDRIGSVGVWRILIGSGGVFLWLTLRDSVAWSGGRRALAASGVAMLVMAAVPDRAMLWTRLHGTDRAHAIVEADGSGIAVIKNNGASTLLLVNGRGQSELPYTGMQTDLGIVPTMLHPKPLRIAVIGLGSGNTAFSAGGRAETQRIDTIEIVEPVYTALKRFEETHRYAALTRLLSDPRLHYRFNDGRAFLAKTRHRYDVIEADALRPDGAYSGNIYSFEYFSLLRSRLKPGGFAVTWLPTARVRDSLRAAFPHVMTWGELGIGSEMPLEIDPIAIRTRLAAAYTQSYFRAAGIDADDIMTSYLSRTPQIFSTRDAPPRRADVNLDLFPRDEFNALR
jgi:predicted membrane-bound spermidine synthase